MRPLLIFALLLTGLPPGLTAAPQANAKQVSPQQKQILKQQRQQQKQQLKQQAKQQQLPMQIPNPQVARLQRMSPAEREKALAGIAPARRQQIETNLQKLDQMPAEQRDRLFGRLQMLQSFQPDRQQAIRQEIMNLRGLRKPDRRARLSSDELRQNFTPEEIQLLREVAGEPE